ncbi:MAG: hypothetical protein ACR2IK_07950 [Chloroflexota bacterium]
MQNSARSRQAPRTYPQRLGNLGPPQRSSSHEQQRHQLVGILLSTVIPDEVRGHVRPSTPHIDNRWTGRDDGPNRLTPRRPLPPIRDDVFGELTGVRQRFLHF